MEREKIEKPMPAENKVPRRKRFACHQRK